MQCKCDVPRSIGVTYKIERRAEASSQEKNVFFPFWRLLWLSISITSIAYAGVEISPISTPAFILLGLLATRRFVSARPV